jgi:UDP-glucose 4-epimerase
MTVPSPATTWVVGAGGLLGQHVHAASERAFAGPVVPWHDPDRARVVLRQGIHDLLARADGAGWNVAWCAGAGVVATDAASVGAERVTFRTFLEDLADQADQASPGGSRGALFFASSAGAVYAGSDRPPFTEATAPQPRAPYGAAKLAMEGDVRAFAAAARTPAFIARIANLYGPGQNLAKAQGLVSHICRSHLSGQPLLLYVPLDTMRDYLYVRDCAAAVVAGLSGLRRIRSTAASTAEPPVVTKILASGHSTTVAGLLGESSRLFRRRPRVVLGSSPAAAGQVRDLRLRSTVWPELDHLARTPLPVGMAATAADVGRRLREPAAVPLARGDRD